MKPRPKPSPRAGWVAFGRRLGARLKRDGARDRCLNPKHTKLSLIVTDRGFDFLKRRTGLTKSR